MAEEWDYGNEWGASYDPWYPEVTNAGGVTDYFQSPAYQSFTGWGDPTGIGSSGDTSFSGEGSGWGSSILGALGSVGSFLGKNAGWLGPAVSGLGSLAGGAIGSNAAQDASRLQADALNRGIDLQTAQWLQSQANQAPWMEAGRGALGELTWRQGVEQSPAIPGAPAAISGANYALPGTTPGWQPQMYQGPQGPNAADYRWNPQQGPRAGDYRYQPGQTPDAAQYASGAPQLYQGAMPGTQVSTLTGQQVLDQDPGAAFRQSEARKALEGSAAARGDLLSGSTLQALQSRSQDLASQEYQNAWQRMMARDTEQYGRNWGQYQQNWNQGVQGTQLGLQTNAQNFGQALSAAQLREQVNQVAAQQGWSQAQAEAALREQMAQQASQQGFGQALAAQGQQFTQGLQSQQWNQGQQQQYAQEQYTNLLEQSKLRYGQDVYANQTDYERQQAAYSQQIAEMTRQWNQAAGLAGVGQTAVGQLGQQGAYAQNNLSSLLAQLGTAQGTAPAASGLSWQRALTGATNQLPSILAGLNA